jgi:glycosyltransferase involved in cell wall biosynthesis
VRILLVEPYFTGSHRAWAEGYAAASRHDVSLITHDGRFWKWRMQGGPVTLAAGAAAHVAGHGRPDLILASSMSDLAALLGIARRTLGGIPAVLYMHENQLTYPLSPRDDPDATYPMIQWKAMAAADLVVFNSEFHRNAWFAALSGFLGQFPDYRHGAHVVASVAQRSEVLPVGVDLRRLDGPSLRGDPPLILWNQRAEHDKGPDDFAAAICDLAARGADFRLALAGERFVSEPAAFDRLRSRLEARIVHDGYADDPTYAELLRRSDIVVSTARQEFFGIAITEAIYAGAFPLLPNRLVYPERTPAEHHRRCLYDGPGDLVAKLAWAVGNPAEAASVAAALRPAMAESDWSLVAPRYDVRFERLIGGRAETV